MKVPPSPSLALVPPGPSIHPRRPSSVTLSLPTVAQMGKSVTTRHLYRNAISIVCLMICRSIGSGIIALAATVVYTRGLFWSGTPPRKQTEMEFHLATMGNMSFFVAVTMILGYSVSLIRFHHISRPDMPRSYGFWIVLLVRKSYMHYVISLVLTIIAAFLGTLLSPALQHLRLHFYVAGCFINYYTATLDVISRTIFQVKTVEGRAIGYVNPSPFWKRLVIAYTKNFTYVFVSFIASAYIHISSRLELRGQEGLFLFSFGSMGFRLIVMKLARTYILRLRHVHVRIVYIVATVPTVLINTQVRIALLRVKVNVSLTGVIVLAIVEPLMRLAKVWVVRHDVLHKAPTFASRSARFLMISSVTDSQHPIGSRRSVVAVVPLERAMRPSASNSVVLETERQAQRLLQFTAAEIHANMCSKYIAIACSMAICYCLEGNPHYTWNQQDDQQLSISRDTKLELVLLQIGIEIVVDVVCTSWELVNGIPVGAAKGIHGFFAELFVGCAVTNISLCCLFYLRQTVKSPHINT